MRRSLVVMAMAVTLSVVLAFVFPLWWLVGRFASERALTEARQPAVALAPAMATRQVEEVEFVLDFLDHDGVSVVMFDGSRLGESLPPGADLDRTLAGETFEVATDEGVVVHQPVVVDEDVGAVLTAVPRAELTQGVARARTVIVAIAVLLIALAMWLAERLGRRVTSPAIAAADVARQLSDGELDARVAVEGPPELQDVGSALNALADRIGDLLEAERERAADLAHRLRTPMQALRFEAEQVRPRRVRDGLVEALDRVDRSVTQLIAEMRKGPARVVSMPRPVVDVVQERAAFWHLLAEQDNRDLGVAIDTSVAMVLPGADLTVVIDVLCQNVLSHTPPGTGGRITLESVGDGALLVVEDDGPGLSPEHRRRGVSGGDSSGLGLDIATKRVRALGGQLVVGASRSGGARIEVHLVSQAAQRQKDLLAPAPDVGRARR